MPMFPRLPLLESVFPTRPPCIEPQGAALVCVQHLLDTTGSLIEKFIDFGFLPDNIHVLGKLYSTSTEVQRKLRTLGVHVYENGADFEWGQYSDQLARDVASMWEAAILSGAFNHADRIVVLDDGGENIAGIPSELVNRVRVVVGVEQTMSGIMLNRSKRPLIPFIGVGSSAAKALIEPPIIREALFKRVADKMQLRSGKSGVVGTGYIGQVVRDGLNARGIEVFTYDRSPLAFGSERSIACKTLADLYRSADIIWGCTGTDHLAEHDWADFMDTDKTLISCSSIDSEFRSVLQLLNSEPQYKYANRLSDVVLKTPSSSITILRGGFPINFNGPLETESARDIQFTRTLLFAGVRQALSVDERHAPGSQIDLDYNAQLQTVREWLDSEPQRRSLYSAESLDVFKGEASVKHFQSEFERRHSLGAPVLHS